MKNISYKLLLCIFFVIVSCKSNKKEQSASASFDWLNGNWFSLSDEGRFYEQWKKESDSLFSGKSWVMADDDTVFYEEMKIEIRSDGTFFIPTVSGQNDGKSVMFKFSGLVNGQFIFENPSHDFPQRIVYTNPQPDSLFAWIEGIKEGKLLKQEFGFRKQP